MFEYKKTYNELDISVKSKKLKGTKIKKGIDINSR